ncbi:hypothetical protein FACS1894164_00270 [Spirochaetia bacterium]|nr:hypothetical protein FACS1894164_00270 [Spirochaetia bacterium]
MENISALMTLVQYLDPEYTGKYETAIESNGNIVIPGSTVCDATITIVVIKSISGQESITGDRNGRHLIFSGNASKFAIYADVQVGKWSHKNQRKI